MSKSITKGLKKTFKTVTDSGVGSGVLLAAAVYTGGAALGLWNGPFKGMFSYAAESPPVAMSAPEPQAAPETQTEAPTFVAPAAKPATPSSQNLDAAQNFLYAFLNSKPGPVQQAEAPIDAMEQPNLNTSQLPSGGLINRNMRA